ncbi:Methionine aminopeptidase [Neochlamydia sp. TUME1]|nr:methionyl aminopeptidase [Neochlamydia sp. TUME1]KIC76608.1 Methionine aminopeptidase [Neochlamydia sp. TUME1]
MIGRNNECWCKSGKKWKKCHFPHLDPKLKETEHSQFLRKEYLKRYNIILKNEQEIKGIRKACHLASYILEETCKIAKAGITTLEINDFAHQLHLDMGAIPAPLHYGHPPFPKSICTSLNEVICHGIPNKIPLREGDILNIDVTCIFEGYYGDCSKMVSIGKISEEKQLVMEVAYECLKRSLAICKPGVEIKEIGNVIEAYARSHHCSVVHQFVGHGVGINFHENPQIPHAYNGSQIPLAPGMIFTIEPMINAGVQEAIIDPEDEWTARTKDGKASAQFEHTLLITHEGHEILTNWQR